MDKVKATKQSDQPKTADKAKKTKEFRQELADIFIRSLQEKQLDWKQGWDAKIPMPENASTGKTYKGANRVYLYLCALEVCGWDMEKVDHRWATYNQIQKMGWRLKSGSRGTGRKIEVPVPYDFDAKKEISWQEYYKWRDGKDEKDPEEKPEKKVGEEAGKEAEKDVVEKADKRNIGVIYKYYVVFNGRYINGIPELDRNQENGKGVVLDDPLIHKISSGMGVHMDHDGGDSAYYRPRDDSIHLPKKETFHNSYEYNATVLHELSHASGAAHRLNRLPLKRSMEAVAYEELVAEISACFMAEHLEIQQSKQHVENHKAYVQSWIHGIKEQPEILGKAINDAEAAADYLEFHAGILSREEYRKGQINIQKMPEQVKGDSKAGQVVEASKAGLGMEASKDNNDKVENRTTGQEAGSQKQTIGQEGEGGTAILDKWGPRKELSEDERNELLRDLEQGHRDEINKFDAVSFIDSEKEVKKQYVIPLVNGDTVRIDVEPDEKFEWSSAIQKLSLKLQESYLNANGATCEIDAGKLVDSSKGVKEQNEFTLLNGGVIHMDVGGNKPIVESVSDSVQSRYSIIREKKYDIAVSKDALDNRCTIHFRIRNNDPCRKDEYLPYYNKDVRMIELHGEQFNVHFPSMGEAEVKKIVSGYLKAHVMLHNAEIGDKVTFYIPAYTKDENGIKLISGIKEIHGELKGVLEGSVLVETTEKTLEIKKGKIYDEHQAGVMEKAVSAHMTPEQLDLIGNPKMSAGQMDQVMRGLQEGLHVYQVAWYARTECKVWQMELYRFGMRNGIPPCDNGFGGGIRSMDRIIECLSQEKGASGQSMEEAGRKMVESLIRRQRNEIIKELKDNKLFPEKRLVLDIERLIGVTGKPQTVKGILSQEKSGGDPEIGKLRSGICKQIGHQRQQMRIVNFQKASQAMIVR